MVSGVQANLELYRDKECIFSSNGRWVYPLFDLEKFLEESGMDRGSLFLKDKIAGRAAAYLMVYMGLKQVHITLLSRLALEVYKEYGVTVTYDRLTDRIKCKTETLLEGVDSPEVAYRLLKQRAGLFHGFEIKMNSLECGYKHKGVLGSVDLHIDEGEALIFKGDNGAGKSTLLKTVAGIISPLKGSIEFYRRGQLLSPIGKIGYLKQQSTHRRMPLLVSELMDATAANLGLKGEEREYQIELALRRTGALTLYNNLYFELSGGERQRVNLARLVCQRAGIFLLDEPSNHLDRRAKHTLIDLLQDIHYREMPTILLTSHDEKFVEDLKWRTLLIEDGGII